MGGLLEEVDRLAAGTGFSGAVRVDGHAGVELAAWGLAHRGWGIANTTDTRFAIASGGKGLTALAVMALVADGVLDLGTPARALPGPVHALATTEGFLAVLDGHPAKFAPGERFAYCNGGYVVLALLAERAAALPFQDLVER